VLAPRFRLSRWSLGVARLLLTRPDLWLVALRQVRRLAPPGWWRHRPFLPVPPRDYMAFRALTMYGDADRLPEADDVLTYLAWCRTFRRGTTGTRAMRAARPPAVARLRTIPAVAGEGQK
jgi:hypothetical protein